MYTYRAKVLRVIDGDTVHLAIDLGLDVTINITGRLHGINAPEMSNDAGVNAKNWLASQLATDSGWIIVNTIKDKREKYGRYLVVILDNNGLDIGLRMIAAGHAVRYTS